MARARAIARMLADRFKVPAHGRGHWISAAQQPSMRRHRCRWVTAIFGDAGWRADRSAECRHRAAAKPIAVLYLSLSRPVCGARAPRIAEGRRRLPTTLRRGVPVPSKDPLQAGRIVHLQMPPCTESSALRHHPTERSVPSALVAPRGAPRRTEVARRRVPRPRRSRAVAVLLANMGRKGKSSGKRGARDSPRDSERAGRADGHLIVRGGFRRLRLELGAVDRTINLAALLIAASAVAVGGWIGYRATTEPTRVCFGEVVGGTPGVQCMNPDGNSYRFTWVTGKESSPSFPRVSFGDCSDEWDGRGRPARSTTQPPAAGPVRIRPAAGPGPETPRSVEGEDSAQPVTCRRRRRALVFTTVPAPRSASQRRGMAAVGSSRPGGAFGRSSRWSWWSSWV